MAASRDEAKEKEQFYRANAELTLYEGIVRNEGGKKSFLHSEELMTKMPLHQRLTDQPTFYPSRLDWSHWEDMGPKRPALGDRDAIKAWVKTVQHYPDFSEKDFGP